MQAVEAYEGKGSKGADTKSVYEHALSTGFNTFPGERLLVSIFDESGELIFIVPRLYENEVRENASCERIISWDDSQDPKDILAALCSEKGYAGSTVAIEDTMWFNAFEKIHQTFEQARYVKASEIIGR